MNLNFFSRIMRNEVFRVGDTEGHNVSTKVREEAVIFASGELAWMKAINSLGGVKGVCTYDQYCTVTFQDGSTLTAHTKSKGTPTSSKTERVASRGSKEQLRQR
jgi:hypothetical protein